MDLDTYQAQARSTAVYPEEIRTICLRAGLKPGSQIEMLLKLGYVANGLAGEAGEFANKIKKIPRDSDGFMDDALREPLAKELGGTLWYVGQAAYEIGYRLEEIAQMNLDQLESRKERDVIGGSGDGR